MAYQFTDGERSAVSALQQSSQSRSLKDMFVRKRDNLRGQLETAAPVEVPRLQGRCQELSWFISLFSDADSDGT